MNGSKLIRVFLYGAVSCRSRAGFHGEKNNTLREKTGGCGDAFLSEVNALQRRFPEAVQVAVFVGCDDFRAAESEYGFGLAANGQALALSAVVRL